MVAAVQHIPDPAWDDPDNENPILPSTVLVLMRQAVPGVFELLIDAVEQDNK